jgi:hypothetical protein
VKFGGWTLAGQDGRSCGAGTMCGPRSDGMRGCRELGYYTWCERKSRWLDFGEGGDDEPTGLVLSQSPVAMPSFEKRLREEGHLSPTSMLSFW